MKIDYRKYKLEFGKIESIVYLLLNWGKIYIKIKKVLIINAVGRKYTIIIVG